MTPEQFRDRLVLVGVSVAIVIALCRLSYFFFVERPKEYGDCVLDHRNDYFLLHDREPIHEACRERLNPWYH